MLKVMSGVKPSRPPASSQNSELLDDVWSIMQECWNADPQKRPDVEEVNEKIRKVDPGHMALMRWMMWIRKWQQQQVDVLHGLGEYGGVDKRGLCLSGVEMDTMEGFLARPQDEGVADQSDEGS